MEYNIELLRESAILDYQEALSGKLTIDPDKLFMESCIDAGFTMDEAVDAALQKIRLYISEEAKICKRLAKETQKAIKKRDWETAVKTSQKRLAHLENLEKRADDIDDDEIYILQMESMAKAFVLTTIISMILVKIADGIVPGSGWLIDAFKKYIQKFKFKDFRKSLSAGGGILNFARDLLTPILTIAGFSKKVSNKLVSSKTKKWQKNRNGDINREVNEGRPDLSTMSVSRTEAKTRFRKMIEAQKQEIAVLKANMNAAKSGGTNTPESRKDMNETVYITISPDDINEAAGSALSSIKSKIARFGKAIAAVATIGAGIAAASFGTAVTVPIVLVLVLGFAAASGMKKMMHGDISANDMSKMYKLLKKAEDGTATNSDYMYILDMYSWAVGLFDVPVDKYFREAHTEPSEIEKIKTILNLFKKHGNVSDKKVVDSFVKKLKSGNIAVPKSFVSENCFMYYDKQDEAFYLAYIDRENEDFVTERAGTYQELERSSIKYINGLRKKGKLQKEIDKFLQMQPDAEGMIRKNKSTMSVVYESVAILTESDTTTVDMEILQEAKLKAAARNKLPDSAFGIPEDRKYPLNDAAHVKAAIKMFSHCPDAKKSALAKRIVSAMSKFGVDVTFDEKSPMYNYVPKKYKK